MNSTEKVLLALEHMADAEDEELREAIPVPISPITIRGVIASAIPQIPADPRLLDDWLTRISGFCQDMRSDDYEPTTPQ